MLTWSCCADQLQFHEDPHLLSFKFLHFHLISPQVQRPITIVKPSNHLIRPPFTLICLMKLTCGINNLATLGHTTLYEHLHRARPNLAGLPEQSQRIWVHSSTGTKFLARGIEGLWAGIDCVSTHTDCIYWSCKNCLSQLNSNHKIGCCSCARV